MRFSLRLGRFAPALLLALAPACSGSTASSSVSPPDDSGVPDATSAVDGGASPDAGSLDATGPDATLPEAAVDGSTHVDAAGDAPPADGPSDSTSTVDAGDASRVPEASADSSAPAEASADASVDAPADAASDTSSLADAPAETSACSCPAPGVCGSGAAPPNVCVYSDCAAIKAAEGATFDGLYWIGPTNPYHVYCHGMNTSSPQAYLPLNTTMSTQNYSTYATGTPHGNWTCNCGVVTAVYSHIAIDPATLVVHVSDSSFATFVGTDTACLSTMTGCPGLPPYAVAQSCVTWGDSSGRSNVDLTGTPFHVAGTGTDVSMFIKNETYNSVLGWGSAGTATIDSARKVVDLTGGGDCGGFGGWGMTLAHD
jgi:hypothetical protein